MGNAPSVVAENLVENITTILFDVGLSATQSVSSSVYVSQEAYIYNNTGNIVIKFEGEQATQVDVVSMQSAYFNGSFDTEITTMIDQVAEAAAAALGNTSSEASNYTRLITDLAYQININYFQQCATTVNLTQLVHIEDNQDNIYVSFGGNQHVDSMINCTQNTSTIIDIKTALTTQITQSATAKTTSSIWSIIILCTLIIAVCGLIIFVGTTSLLKLSLFALGFALVGIGIWLLSAWAFGLPPFERPPEDVPDPAREPPVPGQDTPPPATTGYTMIWPDEKQAHVIGNITMREAIGSVYLSLRVHAWRSPRTVITLQMVDSTGNVVRINKPSISASTSTLLQLPKYDLVKGEYTLQIINNGTDVVYTQQAMNLVNLSPGNVIVVKNNIETPTAYSFNVRIQEGQASTQAAGRWALYDQEGTSLGVSHDFVVTGSTYTVTVPPYDATEENERRMIERDGSSLPPPVYSYQVWVTNISAVGGPGISLMLSD